jgi:regulatory protein
LAAGRLEELARANEFQRCLNAAVHYLSYRPRSEFELRGRLQRRGFAGDNIEAVLVRLREQGVVDDGEFARFWRDNRQTFRPRSRALTRLELRRKGVGEEVIGQVLGAVDDADSAERAARVKARRLPLADYKIFRRRLGEYLRRRGFGYTVISNTVEQLWREMGENDSE